MNKAHAHSFLATYWKHEILVLDYDGFKNNDHQN